MAGWKEENTAIVGHMQANFAVVGVNYQGIAQRFGEKDGEWLDFFVLPGSGELTSLGGAGAARYAYVGVVMAHVFTPEHGGSNRRNEICDAFADTFRGQLVSGIRFRAPSRVDSTSPKAGFDRQVITIPFVRDEVH